MDPTRPELARGSRPGRARSWPPAGVRLRVVLGGLVAGSCAPLIGLDDLRDRPAASARIDGGTTSADAGESGAGDGGVDCTTNATCLEAASGAPAICVAGRCVRIDQHEGKTLCLPQILPNNDVLREDSVVLFAAFRPIFEEFNPLTDSVALAYRLAVKELDEAGGIPGTPRRSVALAICASDANVVSDAVRHATERLRVPAMIANFSESDLTKFVQDYAVPNGVFTLNPGVASETLKYLNTDRLLWNLLGPPEGVAVAYRPFVSRAEAYARTRRGADAAAVVKIALISTDTALERAFENVIRSGAVLHDVDGGTARDPTTAIVWNGGKSAVANGTAFRRIPVDALEQGKTPRYTDIVGELAEFVPDIVIALTRGEVARIAEDYEDGLEKAAADGGAPAVAPVWLLGPRAASEAAVLGYLESASNGGLSEKRKRFLGVQYAGPSDATQRDAWLQRMRDAYDGVPPAMYSALENYYDAVYWLAYGTAAAGQGGPVIGASLRAGVRNLLDGIHLVNPGDTSTIGRAMALIQQSGDVMFVGALGRPDIDSQFGTWESVGGVFCYPLGVSAAPRYDVLRYDRATRQLVTSGTFCFFGFP